MVVPCGSLDRIVQGRRLHSYWSEVGRRRRKSVRILCHFANGTNRVGTNSVLFVKPMGGKALSQGLVNKIKDAIRTKLSKRHVPAKIIECQGM